MKPVLLLKRGLVLFWAAWSSLVFASNVGDVLLQLGLLPAGFPFASGNYGAILEVGRAFAVSGGIAALLFAGVVLWDGINTALFWQAFGRSAHMRDGDYAATNVAFVVALGLWGALMVADEVLLTYRVGAFEQTHRGIFTAMLVSLLAIRLLPNE